MSRILVFPDAAPGPSASTSQSHKAPFRPGKIPSSLARPPVKRNDSIASLPSPGESPRRRARPSPSSRVEGPLQPAFIAESTSRVRTYSDEGDEMEVDDDEDDDAGECGRRVLDPFGGGGATARPVQPDHPQASPTQVVRRRKVDKERIKIDKTAEFVGAKSMAKPKGGPLGWDSPSNPFVVHAGDKPSTWTPGQAKKPEKLTYVFRGKRITYDMPFDALVAEDPEDSPYADPSPRLLFPAPPITPPSTSTASTSFLDALRATIPQETKPIVDYGLPTPAREKDTKAARGEGRYAPYKRPPPVSENDE
ncbi:hypothetical protein RQP46_001200 [Phenoliferia psychrophenolica]